jgi:hypothetical protein
MVHNNNLKIELLSFLHKDTVFAKALFVTGVTNI